MEREKMEHVEHCIAVAARGGMIVMVDDEDRENEGDLVIPADQCTPAVVNFMCKYGRGLICLAMESQRVDELALPMMVPTAPGHMGTAFTVSIEARRGVSTGISAADRAHTIRVAVDPSTGPEDLVSPGHVFPLRAKDGGVLVRAGHTEGSVDLARLAGRIPAGVICEIMRDDGDMARMDDLRVFAKEHDLPILAIADLIEYRLRTERLIEEVARGSFTSEALGLRGGWELRRFRGHVDPRTLYLAFTHGDVTTGEPVLVRAQRASLVEDVFGGPHGDAGGRLRAAFRQIERAGRGVVLYVVGDDLVDAAAREGAASDPQEQRPGGLREFGLGAQVLHLLGVRRLMVMTNQPRKIVGLEGFGLEVVSSVPLIDDRATH